MTMSQNEFVKELKLTQRLFDWELRRGKVRGSLAGNRRVVTPLTAVVLVRNGELLKPKQVYPAARKLRLRNGPADQIQEASNGDGNRQLRQLRRRLLRALKLL
jgi:hypothetical protein